MSELQIFWLCVLLGVFGLMVVAGIAWFGYAILWLRIFNHPYLDKLFYKYFKESHLFDGLTPHLAESYSEYLRRRNEFWNIYSQILLAVLIVTVLAILILSKAISAEAGLPILSGVSGFAIAKGVSGSKAVNIPQERRPG